jgi:hypothetical protein
MYEWLGNNDIEMPQRELLVRCESSGIAQWIGLCAKGNDYVVVHGKYPCPEDMSPPIMRSRIGGGMPKIIEFGDYEQCKSRFEDIRTALSVNRILIDRRRE